MTIEIKRIGRQTARIPIIGTAPLIMHRFDEKSKQQMLDAQQGRKQPKEHKDPEACFQRARYRMSTDKKAPDGIPAFSFKHALVGAGRFFNDKKLSMTLLKQMLFVCGEGPEMLVPIIGPEPTMREDAVRIGGGTADLRYRPQYLPWGVTLEVLFVPSVISLESVVALADAAGIGGVGEWRPTYGSFRVDDKKEVELISA